MFINFLHFLFCCLFVIKDIVAFVKQYSLVSYCACWWFCSYCTLFPAGACVLCRCGLSCYCFHLAVACWWLHFCCLSHCCCLHPCYCWHSCCFWHPLSYWFSHCYWSPCYCWRSWWCWRSRWSFCSCYCWCSCSCWCPCCFWCPWCFLHTCWFCCLILQYLVSLHTALSCTVLSCKIRLDYRTLQLRLSDCYNFFCRNIECVIGKL